MTSSSNRKLHVVSFDIPSPPNYGGVIDVYYKLKALHDQGVEIVLHCFEYGRLRASDLTQFCSEVYYYPRQTGLFGLDRKLPYIVSSRRSKALLANLCVDDAPILFEGIHCTYYLSHPALKARTKVLRTHNLEQAYYQSLANNTKQGFKKWYYQWESKQLKTYEDQLTQADIIACISENELPYFKERCTHVFHLPAFHQYKQVESQTGRGNFCLFHGNFEVKENEEMGRYLCESVFSVAEYPLILAGKNPSETLKAFESSNIHIQANPSEELMRELIRDAQIHVLPAKDSHGVKLKLLHAMHSGRFCLVNNAMIQGSGIEGGYLVANSTEEYVQQIQTYFITPFAESDIEERKQALTRYQNENNAQRLLSMLFPS